MFREINKILVLCYASCATFGRVNVRFGDIALLLLFFFLMHNAQRVLLYSAFMHSISRQLKVRDFSLLFYLRHLFYQEFPNECGRERTWSSFKCGGVAVTIYGGLFAVPRTTNIIQEPINN